MFEGVLTALITPFRDGAVDERAIHELVERQITAGVDGLVPCGSTGESATLSHPEHRRVVEVVVAAARGRVPVIAGTGSNSTSEAVELTRHAKEAGADGALLISPYYNKPTQDGIVAHYAEIAQRTAFPLIAYNIPARTASNIEPATMARLAELQQMVGVKEACGDLHQISEVIARCPDDFCVLSGDDALTLPILAVGGDGVICTTSNVAPSQMVELVRAFRAGDLARARAVHQKLLPLFDVLFCETNPIPVKAAVALRGLASDEIRLPLTRLSEPKRERLQLVMKEFGLL
ncbi:MAG: 4-hydroxy-tetrahydrodipicolinate synthase [Deltaproteobacteria bacterium]|nr:MAG: 4-hydroxy-tetrahydrodipicolinate synthase [Deltaproteobacteria bacterium]